MGERSTQIGVEEAALERCYPDLASLGDPFKMGGTLVDSIAEMPCEEGACYEHIGIYGDGAVIYQEVPLQGEPISCVRLGRLGSAEVELLNGLVADYSGTEERIPAPDDYECFKLDQQADYAVDWYRLQKRPDFLFSVWDNLSCHGVPTGWELKLQIDYWWGLAPRRHREQ